MGNHADAARAGEKKTRAMPPPPPILLGAQRAWVHHGCATYSPLTVFLDEGATVCNLAREVRRGRLLKCTSCGQRGATLGCTFKGCRANVHLPCALKEGWDPRLTGIYRCPEHLRLEEREWKRRCKTRDASDVSRGRELVPVVGVDAKHTIDLAAALGLYTRIPVEGDMGAPAPAPPPPRLRQCIGELACCDCEGGVCVDANTCACIRRMGRAAYGANRTLRSLGGGGAELQYA